MSGRGSQQLASALVDALDNDALAGLADRLAPLLEARLGQYGRDAWVDSKGAIAHLGLRSSHALEREKRKGLPYHQDVPTGSAGSSSRSWTSGGVPREPGRFKSQHESRCTGGLTA